jgi:hypothetical protein
VSTGGVVQDVIAPPTDAEGGLLAEINDNSVAILLTSTSPASRMGALP